MSVLFLYRCVGPSVYDTSVTNTRLKVNGHMSNSWHLAKVINMSTDHSS